MVILPIIFYVLLAATVVLGGTFDLSRRRIPNWITLPVLIVGIALNTLRDGLAGLDFALLGVGAALLVYIPLYLLRGMGAGDVKLMGAIGAIVGPANWLMIFLAAAVIGGIIAFVLVVLRGRLRDTLLNVSFLIDDLVHFRVPYRSHPALDIRSSGTLRLPHGVSIAAGALLIATLSVTRL